jgi:hypothetical protein
LSGSKLAALDVKLHTVGLIVRLLEARIAGKDDYCLSESILIKYDTLSIAQGRWEIKRLVLKKQGLEGRGIGGRMSDVRGKPIVVSLDEFNGGSAESCETLKMFLARDVMRELGIITIVLGTSTAATSMAQPDAVGSSSRQSGVNYPWCFVVSKLPSATCQTLSMVHLQGCRDRFNDPGDFARFYNWISAVDENECYVRCRNPGILKLFLEIVVTELEKCPCGSVLSTALLQSAFGIAGQRIYNEKVFGNITVSRHRDLCTAQFYMLLANYRRKLDPAETYPSALIHRHVYYIDLWRASRYKVAGRPIGGVFEVNRGPRLSDMNPLRLKDDKDAAIEFEPRSLLPLFSENELLYMIFLDPVTMTSFTQAASVASLAKIGHDQT